MIIEVKLARNPEARRAIVSQIISYAAFLHGFDVEALEQGPLRKHLADAGHRSILGAVQAHDQEGSVDPRFIQEFIARVSEHGQVQIGLRAGRSSGRIGMVWLPIWIP